VQLEGAEKRFEGRPPSSSVSASWTAIHLASRLAPEHHAVGQLEHVAARGEAIEIVGERTPHAEELAAQEERQLGSRPLPEDDPDVDEWLEVPQTAAGVLRSLGDPVSFRAAR